MDLPAKKRFLLAAQRYCDLEQHRAGLASTSQLLYDHLRTFRQDLDDLKSKAQKKGTRWVFYHDCRLIKRTGGSGVPR